MAGICTYKDNKFMSKIVLLSEQSSINIDIFAKFRFLL